MPYITEIKGLSQFAAYALHFLLKASLRTNVKEEAPFEADHLQLSAYFFDSSPGPFKCCSDPNS
jgi:hypothetical protein